MRARSSRRRWRSTSAPTRLATIVVLGVLVVSVAASPVPAGPGPWSETVTPGGPPHDGFTPAEQDLFAGTRAGDHRVDTVTGVKDTWIWDGRTLGWRRLSSPTR